MFIMYYIYGVSVPSLLIESTNSMIMYMYIVRQFIRAKSKSSAVVKHQRVFVVF